MKTEQKATVSIIVSTYNWHSALRVCLGSIGWQTILPDEIIVADDGSGSETKKIIEEYKIRSRVPVLHIWQPDEGFRLSLIRNKAIAAAKGQYIVQIDGDLILHPKFIEDHLAIRRENSFVTGSRVLLPLDNTEMILAQEAVLPQNPLLEGKNFLNRFHARILTKLLVRIYKQFGRYRYYVKGCNMAFWKKDLLMVNGYNEDFTGWGSEDSELAIRLMNAGVQKRFLKFGGIAYHLYHSESSKKNENKNSDMMMQAKVNKIIRCSNGISNEQIDLI